MGSEPGPETVSEEEEKREAKPDRLHPAFSAASPGRSQSPCALSVCLSVFLAGSKGRTDSWRRVQLFQKILFQKLSSSHFPPSPLPGEGLS